MTMAAQEENSDAQPYKWVEAAPPPENVLELWVEVGNDIDKNQTVRWRNAVETLDNVLQYLTSSPEARDFCERYMTKIIGILVKQQPSKIGVLRRTCVRESLKLAVCIVAKDLAIQTERHGTCQVLPTLTHVFNKRKAFYRGSKGKSSSSNALDRRPMAGMPEVRMRMLDLFREEGGFQNLHLYLQQQLESGAKGKSFPQLQGILTALGDLVSTAENVDTSVPDATQDDAILVSKDVMEYVSSFTEEDLKWIPMDYIKNIQMDLKRIFDRLIVTRRTSTYEFYEFWMSLVHTLITSQALPLKLLGWEQLGDLIRACENHRPPPRSLTVSGAGCSFVNGTYEFEAETTKDGYARPGTEYIYVRTVPEEEPDGGGKKLTLFRCTMLSQQKWWFLSEADEDQPGTVKDIDYYWHEAKDYDEAYPPATGWNACGNSGVGPPPVLQPHGVMVPAGAELETLEHQLAKWVIDNDIVEHILGDSTFPSEVVAQSTVLIKFMAFVLRNVHRELGDLPTMTSAGQPTNEENQNDVAAEASTKSSCSTTDQPTMSMLKLPKANLDSKDCDPVETVDKQASTPPRQESLRRKSSSLNDQLSRKLDEIRIDCLMKEDADEDDDALYFVLTQKGGSVVSSNICKLIRDLDGKDWEKAKIVKKLKQIHGAAAVREYKQYIS